MESQLRRFFDNGNDTVAAEFIYTEQVLTRFCKSQAIELVRL